MDLINEEDRLSPGRAQTIRRCSDDSAHLGDIAFDAADPNEFRVCPLRNDSGQCSLAAAGWPRENHRGQSIGFNRPAQQFARRENVVLADKFIEGARPHARGKRCIIGALDLDVFDVLEKVLHEREYRLNPEFASDFQKSIRAILRSRSAPAKLEGR
jgi:hypothetical protein